MISIIAAMSRNRVIGRDGKLPWRLPSDLKHFRHLTIGHTVVMGRKTYESLDDDCRPLPDRVNVVLTSNWQWLPASSGVGVVNVVHLWDNVMAIANQSPEKVFAIGGQSLFEQALLVANRLYLTMVDAEIEGDTLFPEFENDGWELCERSAMIQNFGDEYSMQFLTYKHP